MWNFVGECAGRVSGTCRDRDIKLEPLAVEAGRDEKDMREGAQLRESKSTAQSTFTEKGVTFAEVDRPLHQKQKTEKSDNSMAIGIAALGLLSVLVVMYS